VPARFQSSRPLFPLLRALLPRYVTTTEEMGRAMLSVARHGAPKPLLENGDINEIGRGYRPASGPGPTPK
jgi:hypothetical protein